MVRKKTFTRVSGRGLIALLLLLPIASFAMPFELGQVTQAHGEVSHLLFAPPHKLEQVKKQDTFQTDGSYLTQENSYLTVKLFDGSWLRLSPRSKIAPEFDPLTKIITIHLFSGSVKVLYSSLNSGKKTDKIIVKNADASFESTEGKFTVVRNVITDQTSAYVEKGTVVAVHSLPGGDQQDVEIVHASEMISVKDRQVDIESPRKMTERELKFLRPAFYLKGNRQALDE